MRLLSPTSLLLGAGRFWLGMALDREVSASGLPHLDGFELEVAGQKHWIDHLIVVGGQVYLIQIGDGTANEILALNAYAAVFRGLVPDGFAVTPVVVAPWTTASTPVGVRSADQARKLLLRLRSDIEETSHWIDLRDAILRLIMAQQRTLIAKPTAML